MNSFSYTHTNEWTHKHIKHINTAANYEYEMRKRVRFYLWIWVCTYLCAAIFNPWGSNHRVLADHWRTLSISNYNMIMFCSQWDLGVTLCNFSLSLWSSSTHSSDEVEGRSIEPEAVSQSLFTGCKQRVEPTVCCFCAHVQYNTPHVNFCRCVCTRACMRVSLFAWPYECPVVRFRSGCRSRLAW